MIIRRLGWKNGDIDFVVVGNNFRILFDGEENSGSYGNKITLGRIDGFYQ
jgi:hypothetical protein